MVYRIVILTLFYFLYGLRISHGSEDSKHVVHVAGSVEVGSNVADFLRSMGNMTLSQSLRNKFKSPKWIMENLWEKNILRNNLENGGDRMHTSSGLDVWSAAGTLLYNLANALTNNNGEQAIIQHSEEKKHKYSLLENMGSGRVRGPVHIYGHHERKGKILSDSDDYTRSQNKLKVMSFR